MVWGGLSWTEEVLNRQRAGHLKIWASWQGNSGTAASIIWRPPPTLSGDHNYHRPLDIYFHCQSIDGILSRVSNYDLTEWKRKNCRSLLIVRNSKAKVILPVVCLFWRSLLSPCPSLPRPFCKIFIWNSSLLLLSTNIHCPEKESHIDNHQKLFKCQRRVG